MARSSDVAVVMGLPVCPWLARPDWPLQAVLGWSWVGQGVMERGGG